MCKSLLRILLLSVDDGWLASQHVVVNLAIAAPTEEGYPKVLPHMAESSGRVLIHYPTVGAEGDLLPLVGVIRDGDPVQTLRLVEFVDHILPFILEVHLGSITAIRGLVLSLFRRDSRPDRCLVTPALVYRGSHPSL